MRGQGATPDGSAAAGDGGTARGGSLEDLDVRRRRALYRAGHRGTKEMDWLLGRYAEAHLAAMAEDELTMFEEMLMLPDPDLHAWILDPAKTGDARFATLIEVIRNYHGLAG